MTTDKTTTHLTGATGDRVAGRELAEQYLATMERTADLVRELTSLADRYDAAILDGDTRAADSRHQVTLMRAAAESGRQLIRSLEPPALPPGAQPRPSPLERADRARRRDVQASMRDAAAEARDERASKRDARVRALTGDEDVDWADRWLAACDRDAAAGDRADALADRRAAQADRALAVRTRALAVRTRAVGIDSQARTHALVTRLEERASVRQAQGILMQRAGLTAGEALEALLLAATGPMTLDCVADHVVCRGELPAVQDAL